MALATAEFELKDIEMGENGGVGGGRRLTKLGSCHHVGRRKRGAGCLGTGFSNASIQQGHALEDLNPRRKGGAV